MQYEGKRFDAKKMFAPKDRCGPTGKVRYRSHGKAAEALRSAQAAGREESRSHPGIKCGGWPLTSEPRRPEYHARDGGY